MDHFKILRRAYRITLDYRALWVFGILLALFSVASGSPGGGGGGGGGGSNGSGGFDFPVPGEPALGVAAAVFVALLCVVLGIIFVALSLRYLSETSLIRMVDRYEETEQRVSVREGFRLGWNRSTLRIFLVDLLLGLGGVLVLMLLLGIAAAPLLVWTGENQVAHVIGTVLSVGLILLVVLLGIAAAIVFSVVVQFIRRAAILEGLGVVEAVRRGFALARRRMGDVALMALLLFALNLAFTVLMIPVFILLAIAGVVLGGLPALLVGGIASLLAEGSAPYIAGAVVGVPIFLAVLIVPVAVLNGLWQTYQSSAWTLAFREVVPPEPVVAEPAAE